MNKKNVATLINSITTLIIENDLKNLRFDINAEYGVNLCEVIKNKNGDVLEVNKLHVGGEYKGSIYFWEGDVEKKLQEAYFYILNNYVEVAQFEGGAICG